MSSDAAIPDDLAAFIRANISSIWTLELLLFLKRNPDTGWTVYQLVRELRASVLLVADIVAALERSGILARDASGACSYRPANPQLAELVHRVEGLALARPMALRKAIVAAPHDRIQSFADAFRVKKDQR